MSQIDNTTKRLVGREGLTPSGVIPLQGIRKVIIFLILDATGSMGPYLSTLRAAINSFVNNLMSCNLDPKFGLTIYRDEQYGENPEFSPLGISPEGIKSVLENTHATGGGDEPESALPAITKTLDMARSETAQKVVFLLTDASAHDPEGGNTANSVISRLTHEKILFFSCSPQIKPYTDFVATTGGILFPITTDLEVNSFKALLSALTATTVKTMRMAETKRLMDGVSGDLKAKLMR